MQNNLNKNHIDDFAKIHRMILETRSNVWKQINSALIQLYWSIGQYVSQKVDQNGWGKNVVEDLSRYILSETPSIQGFSARNIWRMKQFYETYSPYEKLSTALAEFPVETKGVFKDSYVFEFVGLSDEHEEKDLRRALITHLRKFLLELGPDFSLIGEEYPLQVGIKDFRVDLLLFHRGT